MVEVMNELENKIREALPHLKELSDGAIIYKPHFNVFAQKYYKGVYDEIEYKFGKFFDGVEELKDFELDSTWYIGHPIKLNDVLQYLKLKGGNIVDTTDFDLVALQKDFDISYWDLSSVFLADQNEELIKFFNGL